METTPASGFPQAFPLKWLVALLMVYFGLRLLFFSVAISPYVPPDETTHFEISRIYSTVSLLPENSPETYAYGLVTNIPYLYYWTMGRLLTLNIFDVSDLLFLRLLNIPFAFATVFFAWRMLCLLTDDRLTRILLVVAMTNTQMFSFLSASVSYDNLTTLLATMAVYYLLAFFRNRSGDLLAASFLCQLAGALTKNTFLPLVLVLNVLLLIHEFRNLRLLPGAIKAWFQAPGWRRLGLALGILAGLTLSIQLYGGNYLAYKKIDPLMSVVLSPEKAMQNRIAARNMIFNLFREGKVSLEEALAMTSQIYHPGDREGAVGVIMNYAAWKNSGSELAGPGAYALFWLKQMAATVFGILGHLAMLNQGPTLLPFAALFLLAGLGFLLRWRPGEGGWLPLYLTVIAVFYGFFLMYGVNYQIYRTFAAQTLALQGRYIFPVIGPVYVLFSIYLLRLFSGRSARLGVAVAASIVFIALDFPYFLLRVTPDWFAPLLP